MNRDKSEREERKLTGTVTQEMLRGWNEAYENSRERKLAALALSKSALNAVAFSQEKANAMHQKFSVEVKTMDVTDQKSSGRCWGS